MNKKQGHGQAISKSKISEVRGLNPKSEDEIQRLANLDSYMETQKNGKVVLNIIKNNIRCFEKEDYKIKVEYSATLMSQFILKPYQFPEAWEKIEVSYVNLILAILIDSLANYQHRLYHNLERRRVDLQILPHIEIKEFFESLNLDNLFISERYYYELLKNFMMPKTHCSTISMEICPAFRKVYWHKIFFNKNKEAALPHNFKGDLIEFEWVDLSKSSEISSSFKSPSFNTEGKNNLETFTESDLKIRKSEMSSSFKSPSFNNEGKTNFSAKSDLKIRNSEMSSTFKSPSSNKKEKNNFSTESSFGKRNSEDSTSCNDTDDLKSSFYTPNEEGNFMK